MGVGGTKRIPLTRTRVAEAALALVDREGLGAVTMRRVGAELGVEAMSLYNHVRNKADLFTEISELLHQKILADYRRRPVGDTWQERARNIAWSYFDVAFAHPHAFAVIGQHPISSPSGLATLAECVAIFCSAGLEFDDASAAYSVAAAWLVGAIGQEMTLVARLRAGEGFTVADVPPEYAALPAFKASFASISARDRFQTGALTAFF